MTRVGVFGAAGRMGAVTCAAVAAAADLALVAAADPVAAGRLLGDVAGTAGVSVVGREAFMEVHADNESFAAGGVEVAVDFTVAQAAMANLRWCAENGVHAVCGTTGLDDGDRGELRRLFEQSSANCIVAPNFSIAAALMVRCAALCAPHFGGVEIIELHHERKKDAPSGTSLETARRIEAARATPFRSDPTERVTLDGTRGGVTAGGVQIHSVRLPGLVAHQEVVFGSEGETLTIRHDSTDRVSFMAGVLLAIRRVGETPGLTVGLEPLLGL